MQYSKVFRSIFLKFVTNISIFITSARICAGIALVYSLTKCKMTLCVNRQCIDIHGHAPPDRYARYFHVNAAESQPHKLQSGTVRTNCMDNLDRTNVVQAALAKWTLNQQLISLGILSPGGSIDEYPALSADFRESKSSLVFTFTTG